MKQSKLLNKNQCALVIIDVQERLLKAIKEKDRTIKNIVKLVKVAQILKIPIIVTKQKNLGEIAKEVKKEVGEIKSVSKVEFNCFDNKDFGKEIAKTKRKELILVGFEGHICILQTALSAPKRYRIFVVEDAISSRKLEDLQIAIERLRRSEVEILSTEMVIFELIKKAETEEFKKVLPLIKDK
jgi:nicotinamidase-related amidase